MNAPRIVHTLPAPRLPWCASDDRGPLAGPVQQPEPDAPHWFFD